MAGGGAEEDDLGAMAWPGFVDILSSVLIMFVFFLMLTAVALAFHTALFKSKIKAEFAQKTEQQVKEEVQNTAAQLLEENRNLKATMAQMQQNAQSNEEAKRELETKLDELQQSATMAESKDQSVMVENDTSLVVFYGPDAISLTEEANAQISEFLKKFPADKIKVSIMATRVNSNVVEDTARRVAVARMLNLRNAVIQYKVPTQKVTANLVEGAPIDNKMDWVRMKVEQE